MSTLAHNGALIYKWMGCLVLSFPSKLLEDPFVVLFFILYIVLNTVVKNLLYEIND